MDKQIKLYKHVHQQMESAILSYSPNKRVIPLFDKWSLKDVIAHLNNWMNHDIECLNALCLNKEPYWEPDIDQFNQQGIVERNAYTWDQLISEFKQLNENLCKIYQGLPEELWEKPIWQDKVQTAKKFIEDDLKHWQHEHLVDVIHFSLKQDDWLNPKLKIGKSKIANQGLFAIEPVLKGEVVIVWGGYYVPRAQALTAQAKGKLVLQWDDDLFSVEDRAQNKGYFINHSCEPNLYMQGTYGLIAIQDIADNEELTVDYAIFEADENYISRWDCNCGSKNCRHKITGKDWKNTELQKKYAGHFSPYLNKKIQNKNSKNQHHR